MPRSLHTGCSPNSRTARLRLEALEDRTLLNAAPVVSLDGLSVSGQYASGDVLVQYRDNVAPFALSGTSVDGPVGLVSNLYKVNLSSGVSVDAALAAYRADARVANAEPDRVIGVSAVPNDPRFSEQWALSGSSRDVNAPPAWDRITKSKFTVALMDTGLDYTHPDLYRNVWINQGEIPASIRKNLLDVDGDGLITFDDLADWRNHGTGKAKDVDGNGRIDARDILAPVSQGGWADGTSNDGDKYVDDLVGWDFVENNNTPTDAVGHGTHVAGIVGASGNNGVGVTGVAWDAQLMACKFIGPSGGTVSQFILALDYAVKHGAKISNNSWSGAAESQMLIDAVSAARSAGHILVAAAGNNSQDNDTAPTYPASLNLDNVISVAATDKNGALASFSNYGDQSVNVAAPGVEILSTTNGGGYGLNSGTSMATPFVTGTVALVWSKNPTWTYKQVIAQVLGTAEKSTALAGKVATGGIVNLAAALGTAQTATVAAPKIVASQANGPTSSTLSSVRVTFDKAINASTFTAADAKLTIPGGTIITASNVKIVDGSGGKSFDVVFTTQSKLGTYVLKVGPTIQDTNGVSMAAVWSGTYSVPRTTTTTSGPKIVASQAKGPTSSTLSSVRVTFDRAINATTFTAADAKLTIPGGTIITASNVKIVDGSGGKSFDVVFTTQSKLGTYVLKVGPTIKDTNGVSMSAVWSGSYSLPRTTTTTSGPKIVSSKANGPTASTLSSVRVTFDRAINASTFTAADAKLTIPGGTIITASNVKIVDGSGGKSFDVVFSIQSAPGTYVLKIGTDVKDTNGVSMSAVWSGTFTLPRATTTSTGPTVTTASANGPSATSISSVRVTFDKAIQLATFTASDVTVSGPAGVVVKVSSVKVVSGSGDKVFDVVFTTTQTAAGTYLVKIGPDVKDLTGTNMAPFQKTFQISGTGTFSTATPASILSGGRAVAMVTVPGTLKIADLNVKLTVKYPRLMDLYVHLKAPDGTDVLLMKQMGSTTANLDGTTFDDQAPQSIAFGTGPFSGSYQPLAPLSILNGKSATGTWTLWVENRGTQTGTLEAFSITIKPAAG